MKEALQTFFENPTGETFRSAREAILTDPAYRLDPFAAVRLRELFDQGRFAEVEPQLEQMMPSWALSPLAHFLAGTAAAEAGNDEESELQLFMAQACLSGMLASGEGTREQPYRVLQTADEYDILAMLEKEAESQTLVDGQAECFDLITCTDGSEVWFEVTGMLFRQPQPARRRTGSTSQATR